MKTITFKTNIKCAGCVAKVTPALNSDKSITEWTVDTNHPDKLLTVKGEDISPEQVNALLGKTGYAGEKISG